MGGTQGKKTLNPIEIEKNIHIVAKGRTATDQNRKIQTDWIFVTVREMNGREVGGGELGENGNHLLLE